MRTMSTSDTSDTKDTTITFTVRFSEELVIRMDVLAAKERKSRQRWMEEALRFVVQYNEQADA
jgi:predicted transcriptional regulator